DRASKVTMSKELIFLDRRMFIFYQFFYSLFYDSKTISANVQVILSLILRK
ncbi:hypothetical protein L9F63_012484, partial [Diploptera punctata]